MTFTAKSSSIKNAFEYNVYHRCLCYFQMSSTAVNFGRFILLLVLGRSSSMQVELY